MTRPIDQDTVVIAVGQSNCSPYLQILLLRRLAGKYRVAGDRHGGSNVTLYIGDGPSYARTAAYTHMMGKLAGLKCKRVLFLVVWGETAADSAESAAAYRAQMDVFYDFVMTDLGATDRRLVQSLPYDSDSGGYGSGGTGDTVVAGLVARAAAEAPYTVNVPTSDLGRSDTVHVNTADVPTLAARILAAADTVLAA